MRKRCLFGHKSYHYKIRDSYQVPVASLAVLADADQGFRPQQYKAALWDCRIDFQLAHEAKPVKPLSRDSAKTIVWTEFSPGRQFVITQFAS